MANSPQPWYWLVKYARDNEEAYFRINQNKTMTFIVVLITFQTISSINFNDQQKFILR